MYAIVRTGGKQYQVAVGDQLKVEKLTGEVGDTVELADVLLLADGDQVNIGAPVVEGVKVLAKIVEQGRAKKVLVFKKKRRKTYQVLRGCRQHFTALSIEQITQ